MRPQTMTLTSVLKHLSVHTKNNFQVIGKSQIERREVGFNPELNTLLNVVNF
jgi:hypothetical protein